MRDVIHLLNQLSLSQIENIIPVMETGLEIHRSMAIASPDRESLDRISDTCVFLSLLYVRKLQLSHPPSGNQLE